MSRFTTKNDEGISESDSSQTSNNRTHLSEDKTTSLICSPSYIELLSKSTDKYLLKAHQCFHTAMENKHPLLFLEWR